MFAFLAINRLIVISFGLFVLVAGLIGSIVQVFILITVPYYRKTPCTFYFIVAAIHEIALFITAYGPFVIAALLDIQQSFFSVVWCKIRYFLISSLCAISSTCACLATIDQFLITSQHVQLRQMSSLRTAYRVSLLFVIIWWAHGTLWLYYQDMIPVIGICIQKNNDFNRYSIIFVCVILCGIPILIMLLFGFLSYRNIRKTTVATRLRIDRQLSIIILIEVLLTFIGLAPYGIFCGYLFITLNAKKTFDQLKNDNLVGDITYIFCALAYGGRFYLFMILSPRFRFMVMNRLLCWRRSPRTLPSTTVF